MFRRSNSRALSNVISQFRLGLFFFFLLNSGETLCRCSQNLGFCWIPVENYQHRPINNFGLIELLYWLLLSDHWTKVVTASKSRHWSDVEIRRLQSSSVVHGVCVPATPTVSVTASHAWPRTTACSVWLLVIQRSACTSVGPPACYYFRALSDGPSILYVAHVTSR